jgi:hypothetical protein
MHVICTKGITPHRLRVHGRLRCNRWSFLAIESCFPVTRYISPTFTFRRPLQTTVQTNIHHVDSSIITSVVPGSRRKHGTARESNCSATTRQHQPTSARRPDAERQTRQAATATTTRRQPAQATSQPPGRCKRLQLYQASSSVTQQCPVAPHHSATEPGHAEGTRSYRPRLARRYWQRSLISKLQRYSWLLLISDQLRPLVTTAHLATTSTTNPLFSINVHQNRCSNPAVASTHRHLQSPHQSDQRALFASADHGQATHTTTTTSATSPSLSRRPTHGSSTFTSLQRQTLTRCRAPSPSSTSPLLDAEHLLQPLHALQCPLELPAISARPSAPYRERSTSAYGCCCRR